MPTCMTYTNNWRMGQSSGIFIAPLFSGIFMAMCRYFHLLPPTCSLILLLKFRVSCLVLCFLFKDIDNELFKFPMHSTRNLEEHNEFWIE